MQTLIEKLKEVEQKLNGITDSWVLESRRILCHALGCEPVDLVLSKSRVLTDAEIKLIDGLVEQRQNRVPLQYSLGVQNFYDLDFYVNSSVLIPRPETECLVEFIIEQAKNLSGQILDIGVGSGAIVVSLAKRLPHFKFIGIDISEDALDVARTNGEKHRVADRIRWINSDLFAELGTEQFEIIVSNPPYIPLVDKVSLEPEVLDHEPHIALFGGTDGLDFYRRIVPEALKYLKTGGMLAFEAGHDQFEAIEAIFRENGYIEVSHFNDLNNIPRFIHGKRDPIGG